MGSSHLIETGIDELNRLVDKERKISLKKAAELLKTDKKLVEEWAKSLEEQGQIETAYKFGTEYLHKKEIIPQKLSAKKENEVLDFVTKQKLDFIKKEFIDLNNEIRHLKITKQTDKKDAVKKRLTSLTNQLRSNIKMVNQSKDPKIKKEFIALSKELRENINNINSELSSLSSKKSNDVDNYNFNADKIAVYVRIFKNEGDFVPTYEVDIRDISKNTEIILEQIRQELISEVSLGALELKDEKQSEEIKSKFEKATLKLLSKHFSHIDDDAKSFLASYLLQKCLGLGKIEILLKDPGLEEITINNSDEPIWVYHRKHGWLKTNIILNAENLIKHYASIIARKEGKAITILEPLLDAHLLETGDRVNATLNPISVKGNTITIRKFAAKPWTITDVIKNKTISIEAASLIWLAIQYEMSMLIAGGTASGKTSMLNIISAFLPPNQRIISIEDTRELKLPSFLHWVPMLTRLPNPEGKGAVSMLDLMVNSLRQRPDRILVGEIRRKKEAEVLLEAIHTGHSVYGTVHANDSDETVTRLTNPPIDIPKAMVHAISMILVQTRNRRSGLRRTMEIAEVLPEAGINIIGNHDFGDDKFSMNLKKSKTLFKELKRFTGLTETQILKNLKDKQEVLSWLIKKDINTVDGVGHVIARYYTNKDLLLSSIKKG